MNFAQFLQTSFIIEHLSWLLLAIDTSFVTITKLLSNKIEETFCEGLNYMWKLFWCFCCYFEYDSYIFSLVSTVDFEQVNVGWVALHVLYLSGAIHEVDMLNYVNYLGPLPPCTDFNKSNVT